MTAQIMAESADACVRALLRHCQSPRLLPRLCSTLCKDRSAKLRQSAAEYLIQVSALTTLPACNYKSQCLVTVPNRDVQLGGASPQAPCWSADP